MRGSFIFLGVSLCVLSGSSFEEPFGPNNQSCEGDCDDCKDKSMVECYEFLINKFCSNPFKEEMDTMNSSSLCIWDEVKSPYNTFSVCTEMIADSLKLPWPNKLVEQIFVHMHKRYFQECPTEALRDPPPNIVFALVMTPICLIPAMVVLVVLKTKNGDRRS